MANVLIYAEHKDGKLKKVVHELISEVNRGGSDPIAFLAGNSVDSVVAELGVHGVKRVILAQGAGYENYGNEAYGRAFLDAVKSASPEVILVGATAQGKDLAPHVAARLNVGLASDCIALTVTPGSVKAKRPVYSGKAIASVEILGQGPHIVTIRPNSLGAEAQKPGSQPPSITALNTGIDGLKAAVKGLVKSAITKLDVTEANIVVSGGRSLKSSENFEILEKLAAVLPNAAVGASRAAVDAGYRPHSYQVGQTGKVVSPALYIACGISGAIQHLAGMRSSKVIVAINKDPEAPIFQIADYGIVGDLFEVVPLLTEEFKKLLH
jgi:electron transfer flavoprotein alpha subunit